MKKINTQGIPYIQPIEGSTQWYWGTDTASGDLYEAEELFHQGHSIQKNKLIFIHYPDGTVYEPISAKEGQYFGCPIFYRKQLVLLLVDFLQQQINIIGYEPELQHKSVLAVLPLSIAEDCYNLLLVQNPLMLTRQPNDNRFQILWPEKREFEIGNTESLCFRIEDQLYFTAWYEDPEYHEEVVVRDVHTGEVVQRMSGSLMTMPDGQNWILE